MAKTDNHSTLSKSKAGEGALEAAKIAIQTVQKFLEEGILMVQDCQATVDKIEKAIDNGKLQLTHSTLELLSQSGFRHIGSLHGQAIGNNDPVLSFSSTGDALKDKKTRDVVKRLAALGHEVYEAADTSTSRDHSSSNSGPSTQGPAIQSALPAEDAPKTDGLDTNEQKYYAVVVGRNPGVYKGSEGIQANTNGVPGSCVERCNSEEQARECYVKAVTDRRAVRVTISIDREVMTA